MSTLTETTARDALGWLRLTIGALVVLVVFLAWDALHERRHARARAKALERELAELLDQST